jgi:hypothetical protein
MRTINGIILVAAIFLVSCQKEITQGNSPIAKTQGVTTISTLPGVSVLKDGYVYPNIQTTNNLGVGDEIGWHVDFEAVTSGYTNHIPKAPTTSNLGDASLYCEGIKSIVMYAGQNIPMGTLSYANDAENLYITYSTDPDWYMSEIHLYVGSLLLAPKSGGGTPSPGRFPIKTTFTAATLSQDITYTIPLSSIVQTGIVIAAHASVIRVDIDGDVVAKETAWAAGSRFTSNKNWATYINATLGYCGGGPADATNGNTNNQ